jgi:hypothetical protein
MTCCHAASAFSSLPLIGFLLLRQGLTNQHHRGREQQWKNHEQLAARAPVHVVVRPHCGFAVPFRQRLSHAAASLAVR